MKFEQCVSEMLNPNQKAIASLKKMNVLDGKTNIQKVIDILSQSYPGTSNHEQVAKAILEELGNYEDWNLSSD